MSKPTEEAYGELQAAFDYFNQRLFSNQLPQCLLTFQRGKNIMGFYRKGSFKHHLSGDLIDEIALNPEYSPLSPLIVVLQTLVHEMTHCWQAHFGSPSRNGYHNAEWAKKMESIGLIPSSTGSAGGKKTGQSMSDYVALDGRFDHAARRLLSGGFCVTWHDRTHLVERVPKPLPERDTQSLQTLWEQICQDILHEGKGSGNEALSSEDNGFYSTLENQLGVDELIRFSFTAPAPHDFALAAKTDTSNRVKFLCPSCRNAAWGKPGLELVCGRPACHHTAYILATHQEPDMEFEHE